MAGQNIVFELLARLMTKVPWGSIRTEQMQAVVDDIDNVVPAIVNLIQTWGQIKTPVQVEPPAPVPEPVLRWRPLHATAIEVNLDAPPILSFDGAELDWTTPGQTGWVKVELKDGKLFVADREVVLHLTEGQKTGVVKGHGVRESLKGQLVLHPNILDALFENQHLIAQSWKQNEHGETLFIFFWAQGYRDSSGDLCVRDLCWDGGAWDRHCRWLDSDWRRRSPSACASNPLSP